VIQVTSEEKRPGGAGNVVLNLRSLGAAVTLIARVGNDSSSEILREALNQEGVDVGGLFVQQGFSTPMKNRVIADNQQIVRVDYEQITQLPEMLEQEIVDALPDLLDGVDAIAISDYGKGFLTRTLLSSVIEQAKSRNIPIITDPKGNDFTKYNGTTLIKPNLSEAYAAANMLPDATLDAAAQRILQLVDTETLMITRSEHGITTFQRNGQRNDFPVKSREIKDVTGAGDTVLATLSYAIANGLSVAEAVQLSNIAAGIAIEHFGCARISLPELARRLLEFDAVNKVFDREHMAALYETLKGREYTLLGLSGSEGMTSAVFSAIHGLSKNKDRDLVVFLRDVEPDSDFVNMIASLNDIKFIIVESDHVADLCESVVPAGIYIVVGKELSQLHSVTELFNLSDKYR
ncbi:MAG TPA: bifunctional ADP-heptose synthase, partial [Parachlamydiaceae bacterium]|nr:bifunctional ADP-heptose synthase [Parachlamydiaceae bacterium]